MSTRVPRCHPEKLGFRHELSNCDCPSYRHTAIVANKPGAMPPLLALASSTCATSELQRRRSNRTGDSKLSGVGFGALLLNLARHEREQLTRQGHDVLF